jgi:cytochrome oxidase Cu insertion factor (SCO1/SenC/PrrC family)
MNKPKIIVLAIALLVMALSVTASPKNEGVSTVKSKHNSLFVLKTDKKFIGATVEVVSSKGDVVTSHTMEKRKLIIDFKYVQQGAYTIRVTKGSEVKQFNYLNI